MCSSYVKYWSMKTPRSRATGTGVISFPKMEMATLGTRRRSWGTPIMRIFVLSALINKEFWQHQLQVLLKSSFSFSIASVKLANGRTDKSFCHLHSMLTYSAQESKGDHLYK